jgi:hypothetical protein
LAPKRKDRVAPPPKQGQWDLRYHSSDAVAGWDDLCRQAPGPTNLAWEALTKDPRSRANLGRQFQLKGELATRDVGDKTLEQWQYEVTGGGRLWYCIDDQTRTVWLTRASVGHPSETD